MRSSHKNEIALGLLIIVAAAILGYLSLKIGGISMKEGVEVVVVLDDASGLVKNADVSVAGVKVGRVRELGVDYDKAIISIVLDKEAGLRKDVKASVRAKSLLGEKYLALYPTSTTAPFLTKGDTITETDILIEIDQLVSIMGPILREIDPEDVGVIVKTIASSFKGKSESIQNIITNMESVTGDLRVMVSDGKPRIERMMENIDRMVTETTAAISSNRLSLERTMSNVENATDIFNRKAPELVEDFSIISANLRTVSESLLEDYPVYSGRMDKFSEDIMRIVSELSDRLPQMTEDTASMIDNISSATGKLPLALDNFNELAPDLKKVLERADSVLEKTDNLTYEDFWLILREIGVRVSFF